ncbi:MULTISPECIES: exodeoxyribonuclease V subunit alpha [unclassified Neisseria]|uniref:exodeoxyribonuclease V subunit alpha n=1 Tax=unclassified Neisseria TaxID=2623750 RepID=UPI001072C24C|nr:MULTISPECIES: exodeoxyribonuclease V subunit alpha [unclassified Neisseria]MBF0804942.1 exodeoxyribonuclease V subunit alpha [Neisseria sp. 19428wB4_WF04]TFU39335.1 exodeoxyribonuclease V subunit alpha [Neisseria sp. WF04]
MYPFNDNGYTQAADAAVALLQRHAPAEAETAAPYVYQLFEALSDGHAFIWLNDTDTAALQQIPGIAGSSDMPLVIVGRRLFLGRIWQLERDLAREIVRLAAAETQPADWMQAGQNLAQWFDGANSEGQRDAAALSLLQPFMLISGGPGTGKTTTVAKLLALLCNNAGTLPRIALAAPTGKAAAHMARALHRAVCDFKPPEPVCRHLLQLEGQTVHRLLKLRPPQMQPAFHSGQPLPLDVLVIDEASMLDLALMLQLLRAIPSGCRVILLGDENQLPSVGAGAVLAELAQETLLNTTTAQELSVILPQHGFKVGSNPPPLSANTARLQFSHRFGSDSGIGCLAHAVIAGDAESAWAQFARFPAALGVCASGIKQQVEAFYEKQAAYWQAVASGDAGQAFRRHTDTVVLAARREDAAAFNEAYRRCLQRHGLARADAPWFAGQIVMVLRNDYTLDLFNGDIGLILPDHNRLDTLAAHFPAANGFRSVSLSRLPAHETAFAVTVHKSQGSEYGEVWLLPPTANGSPHGLSRALLYTAVTRARERFVFWGSRLAFQTACATQENRRSALREMINRETAKSRK